MAERMAPGHYRKGAAGHHPQQNPADCVHRLRVADEADPEESIWAQLKRTWDFNRIP